MHAMAALRKRRGLNLVLTVSFMTISAFFVRSGDAIMCWECNSKYDSRCGDSFDNFSVALVDCNQRYQDVAHLSPAELYFYNNFDDSSDIEDSDDSSESTEKPGVISADLSEASICRKTVQLVEDEQRVIRGCGWIKNFGSLRDRTCFIRTGTHQIQVVHCVCYQNGCNRAPASTLSLILLVSLPLVPLAIFGKGP